MQEGQIWQQRARFGHEILVQRQQLSVRTHMSNMLVGMGTSQ